MGIMELILVSLAGAFSGPNQTLNHRVERTKMVKDGQVTLRTGQDRGGKTQVDIAYNLQTSWYAPVGDQKGTETQILPTKYLTEAGYQEISRSGSVNFEDVTITYLGRGSWGNYRNGHKIQIDKSGKWRATVFYHPEIPATGWGELALTMYNVPVLGSYTINSHME